MLPTVNGNVSDMLFINFSMKIFQFQISEKTKIIMSGDTINMAVQSYYNSKSVNTNNSSFTDVLNSLANALFTSTGASHGAVKPCLA